MNGPSPARPFDAILFDLDGTLVDSSRGIEASAKAALAETGVDVEVPPLRALLGLPLDALIASLLPSLDASEREAVTAAFVRHYDATDCLVSDLYPGVRDVLLGLRRSGIRLFVVTNKRRTPAMAILGHHALAAMFEAVYTLDSGTPGFRSKAAMAQACIRDFALSPWTTIVVGDSWDDRAMARECGASFAAAAWGYGDAAGLTSEPVGQDLLRSSGAMPREGILGNITDLTALVVPSGGVEAHE